MGKRAIAIVTSLALTPVAHAAGPLWYGGGAVQRTTLSSDFAFVGGTPGMGTSNDDTHDGVKLFGGLRQPVDWGFYGGELGIGFGGAETTGSFRGGLGQRGVVEEGRTVGLSLVAGVAVQPATHVFGRVGLVQTEFEFRSLTTAGAQVASGDDEFSDTEFALGVEHRFTPSVALRLEVSRVDYSDDFVIVGNVTGDLARFDDVSRDAISLGVYTTF